MTTSEAWMDRAACKGQTRLFFPPKEGAAHHIAEARRICAECPVLTDCDTYSRTARVGVGGRNPLHNSGGPVLGVWAGTTADERATA